MGIKKATIMQSLALRGALLALLALASTSSRTYGQEPPEIRIQQIDASRYPQVSAVLEVVDDRGLPIQGVTAEQVRVLEHGVPIARPTFVPAQQAGVGIGVVLAVDVSGSMSGAPLDAAKRAASLFVDQLSEQDRVAIVSFASQVRLVQDFTNNKQEAKQKLAALIAAGNTKLYDGLFNAADVAGQSPLPRKVVVLLTDGKDTESARPATEGLNRALEKGVIVSTVGLGDADQSLLEQFANTTSGMALFAPSPSRLEEAYALFSTRLRSAYLLTYTAPRYQAPPERTLTVEVTRGNQTRRGERTFRIELPPLQVRLTGLEEVLSKETTLRAEVDRPEWVADVRFVVDGQGIQEVTTPPFALVLTPQIIPAGSHTLEVVVRDLLGRESKVGQSFTIPAPAAPPPPPPAKAAPWWQLALLSLQWVQENLVVLVALIALPTSLAALVGHLVEFFRGQPCIACGQRRPRREPCRACQSRLYSQSQPLGQILMRAGVLTSEQLEHALEISHTEGRRLGEVLTESHQITRHDLSMALRIQDRTTGLALRFQRLLRESERGLSFRAGLLLYSGAVLLSLFLLIAPVLGTRV